MKYLAYIFPAAVLVFLAIFTLNAEKNIAKESQKTNEAKAMTTASDNSGSTEERQVPGLETEKKKVSYAIGTQIAKGIKMQSKDTDFDMQVLQQAIADVLSDKETLLDDNEVKTELMKWQQKQVEARQQIAMENKAKGEEFLKKNKANVDVKETESGLQYQILESGSGEFPTETSMVKVNYKGTLIDGTEFDSSYKRGQPLEFELNRVVKGWTEGLQLIKPGGKIKLFIPPALGYGAQARPNIPGNSVLIFEVELLEIVK